MKTLIPCKDHARKRNRQIVQLKKSGMSTDDIARRFNLTSARVSQIFRQARIRGTEDSDSLRLLSGRALANIQRATGLQSPSLVDLVGMIKRLNQRSTWKVALFRNTGCGKKSIAEIEEFARARGVPEDVLNPPSIYFPGSGILSAEGLKTVAEELGDWKAHLLSNKGRLGAGPKTIKKIENFAKENGIDI